MRGGLAGTFAVLAAGALLGGCAFRPQLHAVAVDHNRLVADTANELTLLNILRARDRQPMHFTSMNVLRGNAQVNVSGSVAGQLVEGDLVTVTPALGAGAITNPSFDIAIYDKKEFQAGIMRPVEPSLYQYFLSNGWPADYLAQLLIERIEFRADGSESGVAAGVLVGVLDNEPEDAAKFQRFRRFLAQYDVEIRSSRAAPSRVALASELLARSTLAQLSALIEGDVYIEEEAPNAGMLMRPGAIAYQPVLVQDRDVEADFRCPVRAAEAAGDTIGRSSIPAAFQYRSPGAGRECEFIKDGRSFRVAPPVIVLRSPDAVMYYLGEYLRDPAVTGERELLQVFEEGSAEAGRRRAVVRTEFMGRRYFIADEVPGGSDESQGRSMQTLSFVQQLINLHKSADELPVSSSLVVQQ